MPNTGGNQPVVVDVNSVPSPQYYNPVTGVYEYLNGTGGQLFAIQRPITPFHSSGYEEKHLIKTGSGTFFSVTGNMNNVNNPRWIMVFDAAAPPANGTAPLAVTSVVQAITGQGDTNFQFAGTVPYVFVTGLYVASSSTGGTYTASTTADCFYIVEYL